MVICLITSDRCYGTDGAQAAPGHEIVSDDREVPRRPLIAVAGSIAGRAGIGMGYLIAIIGIWYKNSILLMLIKAYSKVANVPTQGYHGNNVTLSLT